MTEQIFESYQEAFNFFSLQKKNILNLKFKDDGNIKELIFYKPETPIKELNEFQDRNKDLLTQDIYSHKKEILKKNISLFDLHQIYNKSLYIEDTDRIDVVLAVAQSNKLSGIPLWLIIVGASGDMKSVQLNALRTKDVMVLHNITSKTLVNGYKDKIKYPDLAPELNKKIIIIPDMAQILKLPPIEKGELWGQLRDLYDGFAGKCSGQGSTARYENLKITLLAGSTPSIDGQILVHQDLGTRELIYRTKGSKNKEKVMQKCFENEEWEDQINSELKKITTDFLDGRNLIREEISKEILSKIQQIAVYITYMRCSAEFDNYTNELRNYCYPEEPTRIAKQLKRLFVCLKSLDDNYPDEKALRILCDVAKSSAFPVRVGIYEFLKDKKGEFSTSQISEALKIGKSTAKRECAVLENIGLIICRRQETSYPDKFYEYWKINLNPSNNIVYTINNVDFKNLNLSNSSIISLDGLNEKKGSNLTIFTPEELAQAGYSPEELKELIGDSEIKSEEVKQK